MPTDQRVLAVCVNWNGRGVLRETLDALSLSLYSNLEILVVDNGSTDGSPSLIPNSVQLLSLTENRGFGGALNKVIRQVLVKNSGIDESDSPYLLLLNNDVLVEPETVSQLMSIAQIQGPGIYGPKVLLQDNPQHLDAAWGHITWSHVLSSYRGKGARDGPRFNRFRKVQLLLGCAILVHPRVFRDVGVFDEKFFMYHEEVDFLYRAGRAGYPSFYCPQAQVYHWSGHSTRRSPLQKVYWTRYNSVLFLRKHGAGVLKWTYFGVTLIMSLLYNLVLLRWKRVSTIWNAVAKGFRK